jgi:hypothetical protein
MAPRRYAENTSVPVYRSQEEIRHLLTRHGAEGFVLGDMPGKSLVAFEMRSRRLRFIVPMPLLNKSRTNQKEVEKEQRRRWRALVLVLKAKLEAVASEIVFFDTEFLAYIVVENNMTVGDRIVPTIDQVLQTGKLPPLLGDGS